MTEFILFSIGEFGVIYKAYLQWNGNKTKETVAVKTLKGNHSYIQCIMIGAHAYGQYRLEGRGIALRLLLLGQQLSLNTSPQSTGH